MKYGEAMRAMKRRDKFEATPKNKRAPKGFDITLAGAIAEFDLTGDEIKTLGELTVDRGVACATVGHQVWYRKSTLERVFNRG